MALPVPSKVHRDLDEIRDIALHLEHLYRAAHDMVLSPGKSGEEQTSGGERSDPTGNRVACNCERGPSGRIHHVCSSSKVRQAAGHIKVALDRLKGADVDLQRAFGSGRGDPVRRDAGTRAEAAERLLVLAETGALDAKRAFRRRMGQAGVHDERELRNLVNRHFR